MYVFQVTDMYGCSWLHSDKFVAIMTGKFRISKLFERSNDIDFFSLGARLHVLCIDVSTLVKRLVIVTFVFLVVERLIIVILSLWLMICVQTVINTALDMWTIIINHHTADYQRII